MRGILVAVSALLLLTSTAQAQLELKNDGFVTGGTAGFQSGFVAGEIGASRFVAPDAGRQLLKVQLLFGPSSMQRDVTLKVWDDTAGTDAPGAELYSEDFTLTGSSSAIIEIVPTTSPVLTQQFRVGIVFTASGDPQIARDVDGNIAADRNYIFAIPGGWFRSANLGLAGDWVIRAFVNNIGPTPDAPPGTPDAAGGTPDAATGEGCNGNAECPAGQYCDVANHACTFDCVEETDCGGNMTCNSLGQCVDGSGGGGGCQADAGPGAGMLVVLGALGLLMLGTRRSPVSSLRRRRAARPQR
jgi:hypothetical protein